MEVFSGKSSIYMTPWEKKQAAERIKKSGAMADAIHKNSVVHHENIEIPEAEKALEMAFEKMPPAEIFVEKLPEEKKFVPFWKLFLDYLKKFFLRLFRPEQ